MNLTSTPPVTLTSRAAPAPSPKYSCLQPIIPGFHPDPSICRVGDDYYLVTSSFEYFPGVPIFHSRDLLNWVQIGHVLTRESQLDLKKAGRSGGIWAPTIRHHHGVFYMITTNVSHRGNFYVTASKPSGPWSEPIWIEAAGEPQLGIDPSLFFDDDGKVYFSLSGRRDEVCTIDQAEIDITTGKLLEPPRTIWHGTGGHGPEGPHMYKVDGLYYLLIAEGGTEYGHMVTLTRGPTPWGPWEDCPHNPVLTHRSSGSSVHGTGHADLVQTPDGDWWGVCLGFRPRGYHRYHVLGREAFRFPVSWPAGQWPVLGAAGTLPGGETRDVSDQLDFRDDFSDSRLHHRWSFQRNPIVDHYVVGSKSAGLLIHGNGEAGSNCDSWVGCRQVSHDFRAIAKLRLTSLHAAGEFGFTAFQNSQHRYEVGLQVGASGARLYTRQRIGRLEQTTSETPFSGSEVTLEIRSKEGRYQLGLSGEGGAFQLLDTGDARYLSTEVGGLFTGVFLALFVRGALSIKCEEFQYLSGEFEG